MASNQLLSVKRMSSIEKQTESQSSQDNPYEDMHSTTHSSANSINNNKLLTNDSPSQMNGKLTNKKMSLINQNKEQVSDSSLFSPKAIRCIILWYIFSFTTLFLNKYIVSYEKGDTTMLGIKQTMHSIQLILLIFLCF